MSYPAKIVVADLDADDSSALNALLSTVFSNSRTGAFFAGLGLSSSVTVYLTQGAWIAGGSVLTSVGDRTQVDQEQMSSAAIQNLLEHSGQYVLLNLDADATGYVFGVDGWRHQDTAERTLIHELTHALTIPTMVNPAGAGGLDNEAYREQIAVFAANAVFGSTRSPERQGHVSADYQWAGQIFQGSSASQTSYIDGTEQISFGWSARSRYSAEFHTVDGLGSSTRTYWRGVSLDGGPVSNYITTERDLDPGNRMFEHRSYGFGFYVEQRTASIIEGSIIAGGREAAERAYDAARAACIDLQDWQSPFNLAIGGFAGGGTLADTFAGLSHSQTRLVAVAAERFQMDEDTGSLDRSGPVIGGSQLSTFYVDDSPSMRGAYLLGGSGYDRFAIDLTAGGDRIHGGSAGDVIAVGFGTGQNRAWGGGGDDILIANQGDDWLYGEAGNDVFTGLGHGARLSGGDGFDIATYHDSISGILVDGGSVEPLFGTDWFEGVEAIIGSNQSDVFRGNADMLYFGAGGDDEFHLQDGDVASGGPGADRFIIDTTRGGNVAILDFRLGDQLIVDGAVYTGIRLSGGWYNETLPDGSERTVQVLEKTSSFDHVVQNRQIWQRSADGGSVEFTQDSEFSLYGDLDPGKSDSFVWQADKGLLTFDNNGTKTNVILMNPSGPGFGLTFDWLSHTQFAMWGDRFTDVQPIIQHHDGYYPGLLDQHSLIPQVLGQFDLLF